MQWAIATAAFLASAVEFVEAFTIVLVVGVTINWRSSLLGAFAAAATLAVIVATLGVALVKWVPINDFRLAVGIILILFGLKWLKKAILRYSGLKALHDEEAIFEERMAEIRARGETIAPRFQPFGVVLSYKAVLLEGLEVAFMQARLSRRHLPGYPRIHSSLLWAPCLPPLVHSGLRRDSVLRGRYPMPSYPS